MAKVQSLGPTTVRRSADWHGEYLHTFGHLIPGGAKLSKTAFESASDQASTDYALDDGRIVIPSGTLVGRDRADAKFEPADAATPHEEMYLLAYDVDVNASEDCELVRHGFMVRYDRLPAWASWSTAEKAFLHANYHTMKDGN